MTARERRVDPEAVNAGSSGFYLIGVLPLPGNDQKTGILIVKNEKTEVKIFFQGGEIIYAFGSQKKNRFGCRRQPSNPVYEEAFL